MEIYKYTLEEHNEKTILSGGSGGIWRVGELRESRESKVWGNRVRVAVESRVIFLPCSQRFEEASEQKFKALRKKGVHDLPELAEWTVANFPPCCHCKT